MNFDEDQIRMVCETLAEWKNTNLSVPMEVSYCSTPYKDSNQLPEQKDLQPFQKGQRLEGKDSHFWFLVRFHTPEKPEDAEAKQLYFVLKTGREGEWDAKNPQGIVYFHGQMIQAFDVNHTALKVDYDTEYELFIYFYTGMEEGPLGGLVTSLLETDLRIEKLYYDMHVPYDSALCLDTESTDYRAIMLHLKHAARLLDLRSPKSRDFFESVKVAEEYLQTEFYGKACGKSEAEVNCIGHTHIDVAWLWTLRQTVEKAQRTFATVIELMKEYPEFKFMSSQPQLYEYVKREAPELYEQIREMVKQKRWEPEGAMWLEADCNLTSGESLVRQILFGKRFFQEEFGVDNRSVWLPDVFGYSAAMPQIMKKCGIDRFVTSKISWNETNKMPYDSFLWEGIDGTEIFTYFMTAQDTARDKKPGNYTTYVGYVRPYQVLGTWKRYQQKELNQETLLTFGFGDGGGGPTRDMLEQQRRLACGIPGIPKTRMDFSADFLDRVQERFVQNCKEWKRTPRWVGELYLEFHRGTYTSIAKNKKNNRKSELLLQKAEGLSVLQTVQLGSPYPQQELNQSWKTVLLNQFHDILPGSSIEDVYKDCDIHYKQVLTDTGRIVEESLSGIAEKVHTEGGYLVYNPNGFACSDVTETKEGLLFAENVPAFGYRVIPWKESHSEVEVEKNRMENRFFSILLDDGGNIVSFYDKRNKREIVREGALLNRFCVYEDFPKCYDAWEITAYYKEKCWKLESADSVEILQEKERCGLKITHTYLSSRIEQSIYLYDQIDRVDFETVIDWKQEHQLLKAEFPFRVHANEASYEIQFGHLKRPTHANTSWDAAKFEVCGHRWADLSDDDYGISLFNDCKYGHSAEGSTLYLTLLKSATNPNPAADREIHTFKYSLYPHSGSLQNAGTIQKAHAFNQPLQARKLEANLNGILPEEFSLIQVTSENVIVDTVKKAEDSGNIIVRLYEAFDRKVHTGLHFGFEVKKVFLCDMLEQQEKQLEVKDNAVELDISNFEIVTLMVERKE